MFIDNISILAKNAKLDPPIFDPQSLFISTISCLAMRIEI